MTKQSGRVHLLESVCIARCNLCGIMHSGFDRGNVGLYWSNIPGKSFGILLLLLSNKLFKKLFQKLLAVHKHENNQEEVRGIMNSRPQHAGQSKNKFSK